MPEWQSHRHRDYGAGPGPRRNRGEAHGLCVGLTLCRAHGRDYGCGLRGVHRHRQHTCNRPACLSACLALQQQQQHRGSACLSHHPRLPSLRPQAALTLVAAGCSYRSYPAPKDHEGHGVVGFGLEGQQDDAGHGWEGGREGGEEGGEEEGGGRSTPGPGGGWVGRGRWHRNALAV